MIIDLEPILSGKKDEIIINTNLDIPSNLLEKRAKPLAPSMGAFFDLFTFYVYSDFFAFQFSKIRIHCVWKSCWDRYIRLDSKCLYCSTNIRSLSDGFSHF